MLDESIQRLGRWTSNAFQPSFQTSLEVRFKSQPQVPERGAARNPQSHYTSPAEGQPREVSGLVGKSYETPTITFHYAQYTSKSTPSLCTFPSEERPARPNSRQLFESHPNATPTSWAFPARNAFFWNSLRHH